MAYEDDQNDLTLPAGNQKDISSVNFLPKYFRTDTNKKILSSTVDQLINPGVVEKINSFAGRRYAKATNVNDVYLSDVTADRENYQFEPAVVYKDNLGNVEFYKDYNDYIGTIKSFNGSVANQSILNEQEFYAWDPHIDLDKFINFREYYWLPNGPQPIAIAGQARDIVSTYQVTTTFDGDNTAYIFQPNGITRNPKLKLYKGQTYRFEINAPGHPIAFSLNRNFIDQNTYLPIQIENFSILYTKGIKKYVYDTNNILIETQDDYVENGIIEFTIPDDVPTELFYISKNDVNTSGIINTYEITENTEINLELELIGKKTYKITNGPFLSNGMKVYFQGTVKPEKYKNGYWYVEGVGSSIVLIAEQDLEVPSIFTNDVDIGWDEYNFDQYPFETATGFPATKDYIVINRASADRNSWSRYNRWFHRDVIEACLCANKQPVDIDESARAKRPIIEFEAGLKLFNHGAKAKQNVDLVDDYTKDVFSIIEGSIGYNIDGIDVTNGMRILFTADTDILVSGKIYQANFIIHNGTRQISLIETDDSIPLENDTVLIKNGLQYKGKMFYYNGSEWKLAQDKTKINETPLFDLFDKTGNSLSDSISYPSSSFVGNKIFSYKIGSGTNDVELNFPLTYRNIANIGDIVFDFNLLQDLINYQINNVETVSYNTDIAFVKKYNNLGTDFNYVNGWKKANETSKQAVLRIYKTDVQTNNFAVDVYDNSALINDLKVKVYVDNIIQKQNVDYVLDNKNGIIIVVFNQNLLNDKIVLLKCYSSEDKNSNGFYEIPINLEKNPLNENILQFTLGEVNDHVKSIIEDHPEFVGEFPGLGNLRDLGFVSAYGKKFVKHSGPVNLALFSLTDKASNVIKSIKFAKREYSKFKRQFIRFASESGFEGNVKDHVDLVLEKIVNDTTSFRSFYFSDMIGHGAFIKTIHDVEYNGPAYFLLASNFDLTTLSTKAVGVYRNNSQLLHGRDYEFANGFVYVKINLQDGDIVEVYEYDSTNNSNIPPTPTKLGLYPKYHPAIFIDNTYSVPTKMIQGHDGSLIKAFDDYRDDLILELEMRIFNNIKVEYNTDLLDVHDFIGGKFRNTQVKKSKIDTIMLSDFIEYQEILGSFDYVSNSRYSVDDSFSYNYSYLTTQSGEALKGYWRNVYKEYYDTDRPHTHPWEMLGFYIKPTWWESVYGPAPYTKDNLILWKDLAEGIIREPNKELIRNKKYIRNSLLNHIPVNEYGQLLSPYDSSLAQNLDINTAKQNFEFGDHAPVETAWRRSSEYPFSLITAWCLLQPAKFIGLSFDLSRIERDLSGNLIYKETQKSLQLSELVFPSINTNEILYQTSGLSNYVSIFMSNKIGSNYNNYQTVLKSLNNQLAIKIGGFADKTKLKLVLDSKSPLNKTSVFVPDENYNIVLNSSSALDIAVYSGIILEKITKGFIISGYDKERPYFEYKKPIARQSDPTITVGGISETFVEWNENQQYVSGIVVFYNNNYYRTKITHESGISFDPTKFVKLNGLPIVGGISAQIRKTFETELSRLPYGSVLSTIQDVVDFMFGYEFYLLEQGFVFDNFNKETESLEDMKLCIREFVFWNTQNWDIGTVLSISPLANKVTFNRQYFIVDNIFDDFYNYNILTGDGLKINREFTNIFRDNANQFGIKPNNLNDGIFLIKLPLIQKDHVVLIDNNTVFNDVIYQTPTGYRQERLKIVGYRTDNWNGSLNIPGFIYDEARVKDWKLYSDYSVGDLVKYKEFYYSANKKHTSTDSFDANNWNLLQSRPTSQLLPNWDYKTVQFTDFYDLDTDNFDTEQQRLGQHLIGYQPREYLANIINDSVSQYKFYQGFIQDKGTKNSLSKLFDALSSANIESLNFYEEWAIRLGQYGSIENLEEIEYKLDESNFRLEPQIIELVNSVNPSRTDLVYQIPSFEVYLKPDSYDHAPFTVIENTESFSKDSGYVRNEDVDYIINTYDDLTTIDIFDVSAGEFIWILDENQSWNVYKIVQLPETIDSFAIDLPLGTEIDSNGDIINGFTVLFNGYLNFTVGEIIGIRSDSIINGFYKINSVDIATGEDSTVKALTRVGLLTDQIISDEEEFPSVSTINLYSFTKRRFADINQVNTEIEYLQDNISDKIWVDNNGNNIWTVYKNKPIFSLQEETINPTEEGDGFGIGFSINQSNTMIAIGSPYQNNTGIVRIYTRIIDTFTKNFLQEIIPVDTIELNSLFGQTVALSPDARFLIIGAPNASNVPTEFVGDLEPGVNYDTGDIVRDRGILWKANKPITTWEDSIGDSSTITTDDQDWTPAYLIELSSSGASSGLSNQGVVHIYERNSSSGTYEFLTCITSPDPTQNEKFGYYVEIRKTISNTYRLFVGAPGTDNLSLPGKIYFVDFVNDQWQYSIDRNYKGIYSDYSKYNTDDIVLYNGDLYRAKTKIAPGSNLPGVSNLWIDIDNDQIEYTGYIPRNNTITNEDENSITQNGFSIGKKFDVNNLGDVLTFPHKFYNGLNDVATERVAVYGNYTGRWQFVQQIFTNDSLEDFGYTVAVNDEGNKIAIGAPRNDDNGIDSGCVYIYNQDDGLTTYSLSQILSSPFLEKNESFGTGIDFSKNKIAISGKNTDTRLITSFDRYSEYKQIPVGLDGNNNVVYSLYTLDEASKENTKTTTFDGNTTKFITKVQDTGRIALFQEIGNSYLFAEDVNYKRNTIYNDISNFKIIDNHIYIGLPNLNPAINSTISFSNDDSSLGMFADIIAAKNSDSWQVLTEQDEKINIDKIQRTFLYSIKTNDVLTYLDVIDPRQGKIAGSAEEEISYKTFYDPAVYSVNEEDEEGNTNSNIVVDSESNWTENHVGEIWWDLSTTSWYNPYQGNSQYRVANWNRLTNNSDIDVYEWIGTEYTPSEWNSLADTNEGIVNGISGTSLYGDNIYSSKRVYDPVAGIFKNKFYFWVKNKKTIPERLNRSLSAFNIANLIKDPAGQGYRFVAILSSNTFAIYNSNSFVRGKDTVLHFSLLKDENLNINIHTEYQLLTEGLGSSKLNLEIEQKWFDSLIGYDLNNKKVPDEALSVRQKYGILTSPRQSMFINKNEAVKQLIERVNNVLINYQIVDNYDLSGFLSSDSPPNIKKGLYDQIISTTDELRFIVLARFNKAILRPIIENGKIIDVVIENSGRGYKTAPTLKINDSSGVGAIIQTSINNLGQINSVYVRSKGKNYSSNTTIIVRDFSVLVEADAEIGGRWAIYSWNKNENTWNRSTTQSYDTRQYWNYVDWYATGYNALTPVDNIIDQSYELFGLDNSIGNIVKINNIGTGGWLLLEKIDDQLVEDYTVNYKTIGRQNGTIALSERLYNFTGTLGGYDSQVYDNTFYDREPVIELRNILTAIKNDIFIGDIEQEWNKVFFASLRYAMQEQLNIDWAFKTSFIRAKHNLGELIQKITYQNDNLENYQDYIAEVKPYSAKVREYISSYTKLEPTQSLTTDFDLQPNYNIVTKEIETSAAKFSNNQIVDIEEKYLQYPYKSWVDNNGFDIIRIDIVDGGSGYTQTPTVKVGSGSTIVKAYVSRGTVSKIEIVSRNRVDANNNLIINEKYLSAPDIIIDPPQSTTGTAARAVAILGDSLVRSMHLIMKFDRTSGSYLYSTLNETQTFTGTGAVEYFELNWPMNIKSDTYNVYVNGIKQLINDFTIGNKLDKSKSYDRFKGYVEFTIAPPVNSNILIEYKKDIKLLHAADRINFFYTPTDNMPGKDLPQLMDGVEYSGAIYDSFNFGNEQGFDTSGYSSLPWDTFDNTYEDEIFVLDGSTNTFELSKPLAANVEYNFYLNNVRLDDPEYDATTVLNNPNALMNTIIGDGSTIIITIDEDLIPTTAGDVVIIRKSTSDGSFAPTDQSYDTALSGGSLDYSTASGIASSDINIDGDGFVTPTTSKGPEELVPGQILDTLDIQVYHRASDGVGIVSSINYRIDGSIDTFALPNIAQSNDGIIVKIDNIIISSDVYSINWNDQTISIADSSLPINSTLNILTIGTNGLNLIDTNSTIFDGSTTSFVTSAKWNNDVTAFVTVNGLVKSSAIDYNLVQSSNEEEFPNRVKIVFEPNVLVQDDFVQFSLYSTPLKTYSQVIIDNTFDSDGVKNYHKFDNIQNPIPFNLKPISHNVIVKLNNTILNPGYSISFITTVNREYFIERWQFIDLSIVKTSNIFVYADGIKLNKSEFTFDPLEFKIILLTNSVAPAGTELRIYIISNAEYYFVDTLIQTDGITPLNTLVSVDDQIQIESVNDSTVYVATVLSVTSNSVTIQSFHPEIQESFIIDDQFIINGNVVTFTNVEFIESDSLTFVTAPSSGANVEIYQFSNHDVNNFYRLAYDVVTTTTVINGSSDYVNRNLISRGIVTLRKPVIESHYAWVAKNGTLLTPNIDYIVNDKLNAVELKDIPLENDRIDVLQFGNLPIRERFGYRIFKDILNRTHYKRLNQDNSYELARPLNYYDTQIVLTNATGIFNPDKTRNIPGVLFIDKERIEYFNVSGNVLTQLRRGTLGTGIKTTYPAHTIAYGQGLEETVNYRDRIVKNSLISDGSTIITLDFVPNSVNEIDVFVGGRRLRKTSLNIYIPTLKQDSPEADVTFDPEFSVLGNVVTFNIQDNKHPDNIPLNGEKIEIVRKVGQIWNEIISNVETKSLAETDSEIVRFLRKATIQLPK